MYRTILLRIEKMTGIDATYFVSNGFWVTANQIISLCGSLLVTIVFAHLLTLEQFGNYRYLVALAAFFSMFSLNSIGQSIMQTSAQGNANFFNYAIRLNLWYSIGTVTISLTAGIYYAVNHNLLLAGGCLIIAILQPLISTHFNIFSLLAGQKKFKEASVFQTIRISIITVGSLLTIFFTRNVLVIFLVFQLLQLITGYAGYLRFKPMRTCPAELTEEIRKKYTSFALHQSIQNGILNIAQRLDAIVIFQYLGATQLALYAVAFIIPEQLKSMVKNVSTLLFPKYVHYSEEQFQRSIPKRSLQLFIVLCLLTFAYIILAPFVFQVLFPKYPTALFYSQLLALTIPTSALFLAQSALKAQTKSRVLYHIQISSACIKIALMLLGTYFFGILGIVYASIVSAYIEMALYIPSYIQKRKRP